MDARCITENDIAFLENAIDRMDKEVPAMKFFILPGGNSRSASFCQLARTVCRRAERRILDLDIHSEMNDLVLKYVNRLSDYLFVLSRKLTFAAGEEEIKWEARHV